MLDSVGGSGVQSGTLPVPSSVNNQNESTTGKDKLCHNNNTGESPKRKKKEEQLAVSKIDHEENRKDPSGKEDRLESGIEVDADNVMQVFTFITLCRENQFVDNKGGVSPIWIHPSIIMFQTNSKIVGQSEWSTDTRR